MSFLDRIRECNTHDLAGFRPFRVAGQRVGWVRHAFAARLAGFPEVFREANGALELSAALDDFESRSTSVDATLRQLAAEGLVPGWRDEPYPVAPDFGAPPLMLMERAAVPSFGIRAYGQHMNGYVRDARGGIHMWVGRRSRDKPTFPGQLDNMVAGGLPHGIGLSENLAKEAQEEAAIPAELMARAVPVGAISYNFEAPEGLKPDVQFVYDLELSREFEPRNTDGEIDEFHLWPLGRVAEIVAETTEFKFNCNLVIIDFLVRHGVIGPEEPDYLDIVAGLHR